MKPSSEDIIPRRIAQARAAAGRYQPPRKSRSKRSSATVKSEMASRIQFRKSLLPVGDALGLERIIGDVDLVPVNFLARGLDRARSVCRVNIFSASGRPEGYGTGFMVSPCLLLTNNHVLPGLEQTLHSFVEFEFEQDINFRPTPSQSFALDSERFFYTDAALDFTLVAVKPESFSGTPLSNYGFIALIEASGKALKGEKVSLIQHPRGMAKMLTVRNNVIEDAATGDFLHYDSDTDRGSSGSPVLNDQWEVVALHHSGVPQLNGAGDFMRRDGKVYKPGDPDDEINWIANEGLRISALFKALRTANVSWTRRQLECLVSLASFPGGEAAQYFTALLAGERQPAPVVELAVAATTAGAVTVGATAPISLVAPTPLTIDELLDLAADPNAREADLAPYFTPAPPSAQSVDPKFLVNERLVITDPSRPQESARLLNLANWVCKKARQQEYARRIAEARRSRATAPVRIVAEGDSWFQYPFLLHDAIDHLMDDSQLAVLCFSEAGDILSNMTAKGEFYPALQRETPSYFLISGGGNDMVDGQGLRALLPRYAPDRKAKGYLASAGWGNFRNRIGQQYSSLFKRVLQQNPNIRIVCHGYDHPIPADGPWLGRPMRDIDIVDPALQRDIAHLLVDDINAVLSAVAKNAGKQVRYVNCRGSVDPAKGWHDEFHPTSTDFRKVAGRISEVILNW